MKKILSLGITVMAAGGLTMALFLLGTTGEALAGFCKESSQAALAACRLEVKSDFNLAEGRCLNLPAKAERGDCLDEAEEDKEDGLEECGKIHRKRLGLCRKLGGRYNPDIGSLVFTTSITNPFFYPPVMAGNIMVYEADTEDGLETIHVEDTGDTRDVMGVTCRVIRDRVWLDGDLIEDTLDWYAQDGDGNVWYFGEESKEYEDGNLASLEGSWEAGVDGAQPGVVMPAPPQTVGDIYRQEFLLGEAEDVGKIIDLNGSASVPYVDYTNLLVIKDINPNDPGVVEYKYSASGVGVVLEEEIKPGSERVELTDIITP